ncbi:MULTISPECIES: acyl-CoA dehydrogenase family protein [Delftia]|uniref:acyl-CoA dehydrogenase family protein n=1 Tax=Delftia TaxID=80865 RepID=UPI0009272E04|nr:MULTISPECIES: acyl-CoA dehydrogenase family protein [Delftia]MDH0421541.1 acyl-CoA/acyl-ACP dehydrogenase [Delftia tsuruhatensis]OJX09962.1 MAG: acyl-CoA dehydrogenase [Delftia sp. 67-8]QFS63634.1 acyl-CoA dehydrogenase [Delftia tsuruhatensis]WON90967.1 acyl-CoA/acyl-ACP dehydrogenase [Delftia sp. UGAL515B_04]
MLADSLRQWLDAHADSLDEGPAHAHEVLPRLAQHGLFGLGVPVAEGGQGGSLGDALEAIAGVAGHSLTAGFVFWAQRAFVEYLLQSPNAALRQRWLPGLLQGTQAGATGLSNAMKYLGGIEALQVEATPVGTVGAVGADGLALRGRVPWATNLVPPGRFVVAVAVSRSDGARPFVAALPGDAAGLQRSADLDLIALRGSHTAALSIEGLQIGPADVIHADANHFLPRVRPAFMGLQLGLCIGLARASLAAASARAGAGRDVLGGPLQQQRHALELATATLHAGLSDGRFLDRPQALFRLRLELNDIVQQSLQLELHASGGRAYHRDQPLGFARRWREAAFIPIVTPSVTQLQGALAGAALATTSS